VGPLGLSVADSSFQKLSSRFQREEDMIEGGGGGGGGGRGDGECRREMVQYLSR
jgi:hypothetical protein